MKHTAIFTAVKINYFKIKKCSFFLFLSNIHCEYSSESGYSPNASLSSSKEHPYCMFQSRYKKNNVYSCDLPLGSVSMVNTETFEKERGISQGIAQNIRKDASNESCHAIVRSIAYLQSSYLQ